MRAIFCLLVMLALVPSSASAVSVQEIVWLSKAGVSEQVVLALIDRDRTIFTIDPAELVSLKKEGVSETIILAMLRSGRQPLPGIEGVEKTSSPTALPVPDVIIVGHGPDRPNGYQAPVFVVAHVVPYLLVPALCPTGARPAAVRSPILPPAAGTFGRFMSDPTARFLNDGFLPAKSATVR
jgi:hypothetical protein